MNSNKAGRTRLTRTVNDDGVRTTCKFSIIQPPAGLPCQVVWDPGPRESCCIEGPIPVMAFRIKNDEISSNAVCFTKREDDGGSEVLYTDPDGVSRYMYVRSAGEGGADEGLLNALVLGSPDEWWGSAFSRVDESHLRFSKKDADELCGYLNQQKRKREEREKETGGGSTG